MVAKLVGTNNIMFSPKLAHPQSYLKQQVAPQLISADFDGPDKTKVCSIISKLGQSLHPLLFILSNGAVGESSLKY